jgi:hypothetical protein
MPKEAGTAVSALFQRFPQGSLPDLLADAKIAEDYVKQIFDIDRTGNPAEAAQGEAEIFCAELGQAGAECALQRQSAYFERLTMAGAGQNRGL